MINISLILHSVIGALIVNVIVAFFSRSFFKEWLKQTKLAKFKTFISLLACFVSVALVLTLFTAAIAFVIYRNDIAKWDLVIAAMNIGISTSLLLTACLIFLAGAFGKLDNNFIENIKTWSATFVAFAMLFSFIQITHDYRKYIVLPKYQKVPIGNDIDVHEVIKPDR